LKKRTRKVKHKIMKVSSVDRVIGRVERVRRARTPQKECTIRNTHVSISSPGGFHVGLGGLPCLKKRNNNDESEYTESRSVMITTGGLLSEEREHDKHTTWNTYDGIPSPEGSLNIGLVLRSMMLRANDGRCNDEFESGTTVTAQFFFVRRVQLAQTNKPRAGQNWPEWQNPRGILVIFILSIISTTYHVIPGKVHTHVSISQKISYNNIYQPSPCAR
jgi:hypothetical protein